LEKRFRLNELKAILVEEAIKEKETTRKQKARILLYSRITRLHIPLL